MKRPRGRPGRHASVAPDGPAGAGPVPPWGTPREAARICVRRSTLRRTIKIALIVGTLLSLINQGDRIVAGAMDAATWVRILANYFIPWAVSSLGFLSATRGSLASRSGQRDLET